MSRLGELLVRNNLLSADDLRQALAEQATTGGRLGAILARRGLVGEDDLVAFLSRQYGLLTINLENFEIDPEVVRLVPIELAKKHRAIPVTRTGSELIVATSDPANPDLETDFKFRTGYKINVVVVSDRLLDEAIAHYYDTASIDTAIDDVGVDEEITVAKEEKGATKVDLAKMADEPPVIKLCNMILLDAHKKGASDVTFEPQKNSLRVRYRIDGEQEVARVLSNKMKDSVLSRVKIMAEADIAERRLPQDGRIKLVMSGKKEIEFRVSVLPSYYGEDITLRIIDQTNLQLDMTKLGFDKKPLADFQEAIAQDHGMVLVTGPTGSGKTTTLYSALSRLNTEQVKILTAEDPVEYNLDGITQVKMLEDIGLTFDSALRQFLRHDPDIIMVGEIRDYVTAEVAVKAALTGHVVLSTLHTNDAPSTITRLLNLGVEPFLVTASVNLVLAQRLVRKICEECRAPVTVSVSELVKAGFKSEEAASLKLFKGVGCKACRNKGYKGRVALYEVMPFTDSLKELVNEGASAIQLKAAAVVEGMQTLRAAGLEKIKAGITTIEEVAAVTSKD